ncbi:LacI family DNA-binding transcriptional regulator [Sphingomonas sp. MMS24-J13]|uniref:LacI family DNA-binding transcriptional regulator n=1 Tax=Sphingomonas sp. MMS24-J13 TaxID=3238686 RepID=UPI00384F6D19
MARRITLKEVAKTAGVSLASASYAVNRTGSLGEELRQHILRVAEELGYRQNMSARATRTGRTGTIGLVLPDLTNPFFPHLAQSVVQRARAHGYSVFVTDTEGVEDLEREALRVLAERGVDGLVWFPIRDVNTAEAETSDIPTIVVDRTLPRLESVQADYANGGRAAIRHLLDLGHRRIGIVCGPTDIASMRDRCDAAAALVRAEGELVFMVENSFSIDLDGSVTRALDQNGATAVFAGADIIALGIMRHLQAQGSVIPGDISVVGFDDIPWAQMSTPTLTTIEMPIEDMASEAVEAVIRRIEGSADLRRRVILDTALVVRGSTGPVPH